MLIKLILRKILNVEKIVILKILKIGGLIVRVRGYVVRPPASKLKRLPPPPLIPSQKILLIQVKKDFAIEGLSCSTSCYYC